jgi:predicted nucleic acid-binding protein
VLVVDASVIVPALVDDGEEGARCRNRLRGERLAAPDLLPIEALSALRRWARAGGLSAGRAAAAVEDLLMLPVAVYASTLLLRRMWQLRDNLTSYDACYLALAEALDAPLLTRDSRLGRVPGARCPVEVLV